MVIVKTTLSPALTAAALAAMDLTTGAETTVRAKVSVTVKPPTSVAVTITSTAIASAVGVPLITPVAASILIHEGLLLRL